MNRSVLLDPALDEEIHRCEFASGLTAYVVRKPGFTKSYAALAAPYGSIDTTLRRGGETATLLPDGVAHFLEHKVFETKDGDAFDLFAARGASANAYTSFSSTRYLFGSSRDYAGNLRLLLDTVFDLFVTDENVEKEKGIIGQEIAMYDDDPDWRLYFGGLTALYAHHPVRIDIAGTAATIAGIGPDLLRSIHAAYYHPRRMVLAAVSPDPVEATFDTIEQSLGGRSFGEPAEREIDVDEPRAAAQAEARMELPVARPRLLLGFKDVPPKAGGRVQLRQELATAVALDCLFGNSGSIFLPLYEEGLVDEHFSCSYEADRTYAFGMIGGETDDPDRLRGRLEGDLDCAARDGISADDVERVRNKEVGVYARAFNAPEAIANLLVQHHLRGTTVIDYREELFALEAEAVNARLRELLQPASRACVIATPRSGAAS